MATSSPFGECLHEPKQEAHQGREDCEEAGEESHPEGRRQVEAQARRQAAAEEGSRAEEGSAAEEGAGGEAGARGGRQGGRRRRERGGPPPGGRWRRAARPSRGSATSGSASPAPP